MKKNPKTPCGECNSGTYAVKAVLEGLYVFGDCLTTKDALRLSPPCKCAPGHICYGARDWIIAAKLPLTEKQKEEIINLTLS